MFFCCRLQKYYIYIIMKSCNQKCIKICSSVFCIYVLIIILFHLQMVYILYSLTALSAVLQEAVSVTVSTIQYSNAYHSIQYYYTIALILIIIIIIIHYYYLLTNSQMLLRCQTLPPFQLPCYEYTIAHA